jgi:hypothetical protein
VLFVHGSNHLSASDFVPGEGEFLGCLYPPEPECRPLSSPERLVGFSGKGAISRPTVPPQQGVNEPSLIAARIPSALQPT